MLPILDPIPKGIAMALGAVALSAVGVTFFLTTIPAASPELLRNLATVNVALLLGYVIEAVWLAERSEVDDEYEEWLGFLVGVGIAGLAAVGIALLGAEHRAAGHDSFLDDLALGWVAASMLVLGSVLVLQPLFAHTFGRTDVD